MPPPLIRGRSRLIRSLALLVFEREKNFQSKGENQQQTQPTYDGDAGICTRATLVGGERSHHTVPPLLSPKFTLTCGRQCAHFSPSSLLH